MNFFKSRNWLQIIIYLCFLLCEIDFTHSQPFVVLHGIFVCKNFTLDDIFFVARMFFFREIAQVLKKEAVFFEI